MSFYIDMRFRKVTPDEVLCILNEYRLLFSDSKVQEHVQRTVSYVYHLRKQPVDWRTVVECVRTCTRHTFLYYPTQQVLVSVGFTGIDKFDNQFPVRVEFQNSCDRDYSFDTWNELTSLFPQVLQIVNRYENMTESELTNLSDGYIPDDIEYYRRTLCYEEIEKYLQVQSIVYGHTTDILTFTIIPSDDDCEWIGSNID